MDKEPVILHCDINNFYASVECVLNPKLKTMPVVVAGNPQMRHGVVLAKNEIAKKRGIKTGHVLWEAKQLCPNLICLPPQHSIYQQYSRQIFQIYTRFTDKVESFGPDECWLDVTDFTHLFGTGEQIANKLRKIVFEETGLTISVGVSFNKYFAKLGSDLKKPNATTIINKNNFKQKIGNLPVNSLIMIGKKTYEKLTKLNIHTINELADADVNLLKQKFGIIGEKLSKIANGTDDTKIASCNTATVTKSVGNGYTTKYDLKSIDEIETLICTISEKVAFRMRQKNVKGKTVHVWLKNWDLTTSSHSQSMCESTNIASEISDFAISMLHKYWKVDTLCLRAIRVSVSSLEQNDTKTQIKMFESKKHNNMQKLDKIIDKMRDKYGYHIIKSAKTVNCDFIDLFEASDENED